MERLAVAEQQRQAFARVAEQVAREHEGRIRVRRIEAGDSAPLQSFLLGLQERGVTRWWNAVQGQQGAAAASLPRSPQAVADALEADRLADLGMSDAVASTFSEAMTRRRRRELAALRCPDISLLEMRVGEDQYRPLARLSGGQRVSLLLSLLLETQDDRPLVIDQPEDELDNRFLDTNTVSALMRGNERISQRLLEHHRNEVVLPQPVVSEIEYGLTRMAPSRRRQILVARWMLISAELGRVEWTDAVSRSFGSIKASLEKRGQIIEDLDIAVAAHAIASQATLITSNTKHFERIQGLHHEDWAR